MLVFVFVSSRCTSCDEARDCTCLLASTCLADSPGMRSARTVVVVVVVVVVVEPVSTYFGVTVCPENTSHMATVSVTSKCDFFEYITPSNINYSQDKHFPKR